MGGDSDTAQPPKRLKTPARSHKLESILSSGKGMLEGSVPRVCSTSRSVYKIISGRCVASPVNGTTIPRPYFALNYLFIASMSAPFHSPRRSAH